MNIVLALCVTALHRAAPLSGRSLEARHKPASHEAEPHTLRDNNIAELLIPLLERSLDNKHDSKHKKVIQVVPYEGSKEHPNKGWRKLKSNKKQLVEITPLRRKVGHSKHLAYILSAAQDVNDGTKDSASSEENSFEGSAEFENEQRASTDDEHRVSSEEQVPSEVETVPTEDIDVIHDVEHADAINLSSENVAISKKLQNDDNKEVSHINSDEIVIVQQSEENDELELVQDSEDAELSVNADSEDLLFGPGNNILFQRGSSESDLNDHLDEKTNGDINQSGDEDAELGLGTDSTIDIASTEPDENTHEIDEVTPVMVTVGAYEVEARDMSLRDDADSSNSDTESDINRDERKDVVVDRSGNKYEFEGKDNNSNNSNDVIEVLRSVEGKGSKYNCDKAERDSETWRRSPGRDHKSYRLSFLFNK